MTTRPVVIVVAMADNNVIGASGGLPWRVRSDLKKFRALTMGKPMIMGRKTFESIGRALDGRDSIVVSRQAGYRPGGAIVAPNIAEALSIAEERALARGADEICIIGGGDVFAETLPLAQRLHVTHIAARPEGDTVFPEIRPDEWAEVSREPLTASDGDTAAAEYAVYERRG